MELSSLSIVLGFNESDGTYGWNGDMTGFTMMYSHFTDVWMQESHSFPLSPGLIPISRFQTVYKSLLNEPFTSCAPADAINNYTEWRMTSKMPGLTIYKKR